MDNNNFSYIYEDIGYPVAKTNYWISLQLPYKPDVEPRLIQFLRTLVYYKIYGIKPCVPIYMEYMIKKEDWIQISRYIRKYNICIFKKLKKV